MRESRVWGVGVRLIDRPDNALADWPTVLSDPHLIPTSPHPFCQKLSFTMLLQPAEKAWPEDWLRTSSSWRAELSFVSLGAGGRAKELYRLKKKVHSETDGWIIIWLDTLVSLQWIEACHMQLETHKRLCTFLQLLINNNNTNILRNCKVTRRQKLLSIPSMLLSSHYIRVLFLLSFPL